MTVANETSRVLIVGATGFMGRFITQASLDSGRVTYVLTRSVHSNKFKSKDLKAFEDQGAILLQGSVCDQEFMEKTLKEKEIDTVISAMGGECLLDQIPLILAIKAVGTVKRFLPSEFGHDVDRADPVEPGLTMYNEKRRVRRLTEELGIPYTYICCNSIASWPYYDNTHPSEVLPPLEQFQIYGDGNVKGNARPDIAFAPQQLNQFRDQTIENHLATAHKVLKYLKNAPGQAYFVAGSDIGKYTMKAAYDIRTVNKRAHFRPACNFLSMNELAALWETKIGRLLPRIFVSGDDLLAVAAENIIPESIVAAFTHDIFIKGCQTSFSSEGPNDTEVSNLYPVDSFVTVDVCFDEFYAKLNNKSLRFVDEDIDDETHLVVDIADITRDCTELNYIP